MKNYIKVKKLLFCLLFFGLIIQNAKAQSKKELRFRITVLESQVSQLKDQKKKLAKELEDLKNSIEEKEEDKEIDASLLCDSLLIDNNNMKAEILLLKNELYNTKLSRSMDSLSPLLKRKHVAIHSPGTRRKLEEEFDKHYLSNCFRLKTSQRLFHEQIIIEYEMNPVTKAFEGYIRHQYVPDLGADEYNFQRVKGFYEVGKKGTIKLTMRSVDGNDVDIVMYHNPKRDIYNAMEGDKEQLAAIKTRVVALNEFFFFKCR